jgi:hypothetical protein
MPPITPHPTSITSSHPGLCRLPTLPPSLLVMVLFYLNDVLVAHDLVQSLLSVCHFTTDNSCSIVFDSFGLSMKDLATRHVLARYDSTGPLYTLPLPTSTIPTPRAVPYALATADTVFLAHLLEPFNPLTSYIVTFGPPLFRVSLVTSITWSDTFPTLTHFFTIVSTQFGCTIRSVQCDNGHEFDNSSIHTFFLSHGVQLRMSCPYTSMQNGKAERMICTTNDVMRSLLFKASLPTHYWAESLYATTYLLNLLPTKAISTPTPHFALFGTTPSYVYLCVFGCACYPNTSATAPHNLAPRSCRCVFLRYSSDHKGYRCLDLTMNRLLISRHNVFDESSFPFASSGPPPDDLDSLFSSSPAVHAIAPPWRPSPCHAWHRRRRPRLHLRHAWPWLHASPNPPCVPAMTSGNHVRAPPGWVTVARDPRSTHLMVTRRAVRVTKPVDRLQLSVVAAAAPPTLSPVPTSVRSTLTDPH